uniref:CSON011354 protein n=1 Tax=Culicoides sonorensis TaxID=179676 RepID=A0A336M8Q4_CULSO
MKLLILLVCFLGISYAFPSSPKQDDGVETKIELQEPSESGYYGWLNNGWNNGWTNGWNRYYSHSYPVYRYYSSPRLYRSYYGWNNGWW